MHAAVLHDFGGTPRFAEFPEPEPGEGEALVRVTAAALTPLARWVASDRDFSRGREVPFVCGTEGIGRLEDGTRVSFGVTRPPFGTMAEFAIAPKRLCTPIPDEVDDVTAAAMMNPGLSAWSALSWGAKLRPGETVLVLGGTGVAGKTAIQIAKLLGAGRVVAAGRNERVLTTLGEYGADLTVSLDQTEESLADAFREAAGQSGYDVVLDYLWGRPAQVLLEALPRRFMVTSEIRYLQLGSSAGTEITLRANALRRTGVTMGAGAPPPIDFLRDLQSTVLGHAASGVVRVDTETVPLADVAAAWRRDVPGRRFVVIP
ncbi:quinone oxidoreductase family protein [Saccharomonospora piscinae]|uniref:quinone oxidoreductase family protein n=1 Tax=Saccharomonospora piscinae TaxID=687388 RepID=UPI000465B642|nr:zinc-binding alcohol dehydrogenase family protein [Saccharomonospora piscinae]